MQTLPQIRALSNLEEWFRLHIQWEKHADVLARGEVRKGVSRSSRGPNLGTDIHI